MLRRSDIHALSFIAPVENVPSILRLGILSHRRATRLCAPSIADPRVQQRRSGKRVPNGRPLHAYANLYFCARNPMLFARRSDTVCVLRVHATVLDRPGVVVTDQNAASRYARFGPAAETWPWIDGSRVFADSWRSEDQVDYWRRKAAKCAEVLVPDSVPPAYVFEARVGHPSALGALGACVPWLPIMLDPYLFFQ